MEDYNIKTDTIFAIQPDEATDKLKGALLKDIQRSCYVYRVDCGGCNGCEIEIFAAITPIFDAERFGIKVVSSPRHADVLVYTGSMTRSMRVPALRAYHAAPNPKVCVAYGACGCSGGIFHDLYCVWGGADKILPIDMYIPGCPPNPEALMHGLMRLQEKIKAFRAGEPRDAAERPPTPEHMRLPRLPRLDDPSRPEELSLLQTRSAGSLGLGTELNLVELRRSKEGEALEAKLAGLRAPVKKE